jgi:hypothetical protein
MDGISPLSKTYRNAIKLQSCEGQRLRAPGAKGAMID